MFFVTEILSHCKSCLSDTHTSSRRLVHLTKYQSCLLKYARRFHLCPEVISFTGTLSDTCKDRISTMLCCYISDQLLNQYSLTNSGSSEQTNLTTFCIWCKKVDDLDTCLKDLDSRTLLFKCRRLSVDFPALCIFLYFFSIIDGLTKHIEQTSKCLISNWNFDTASSCTDFHIFVKSFTCSQHQTTYFAVSQMLCNFHNTSLVSVIYLKGIFDIRKLSVFK